MKRLYFLIGYPGSGKSTLAKKLKNELGFDYVSIDEVLDEMYFKGLPYSETFSKVNTIIAQKVVEKGMKSKDIVLDVYKPYRYERADILSKIPETYEKIAVIMDTDKDTCVKRFNKREKAPKNSKPSFYYEDIESPEMGEFDRIIHSNTLLPEV